MGDKERTQAFSDQTIEVRMSDMRGGPHTSSNYFTLTVIEGQDFGAVFQLDKPETVLGRSDEADIRLDDAKASRRHALITIQESSEINEGSPRIVAIDLNSKNGIFVNGEKVPERELRSGDKIHIGDTILKFEIKDCLDISYHEKLYQQAKRDALTGLWNRAYAQEELEKLLSVAIRYSRPFSVLLFDIDHFKGVNDNFGHDVGDSVLRITAEAVMAQLRTNDVAARYGGEEFIILLPETAVEGALITAERLRQAIESTDFAPYGCKRAVTVSIGVAPYPSCGHNGEELVKQADSALYRAKKEGRNRACLAAMVGDAPKT
jgi:two-component system, cell cycle response regulator